MPQAVLSDRSVLLVSGEAAADFLQNLVTADVEAVREGEARPAALLTPQGKILFDFLLSRATGGFRLDVARAARADLAKRLTLYRLRTKIAIEPRDETVRAVWDEAARPGLLADRRFSGEAVFRAYGESAVDGVAEGSTEDFLGLRLRAGVAEAEVDFPGSDVFPHDVLLDQNGGVSFGKGCYVGQEVVSRMQHRGTARRRLMLIEGERHLTPGAVIEAEGRPIGTVLTTLGAQGIGLVRIDRLVEAAARGETISADGVPVDLQLPPWAGFALPEPSALSDEPVP